MAMADFLKALATVEDETVHGVVGAFMTADAVAHHAFGKSPIFFDAARVQRIAATLQTYFGIEPLGRPAIDPQPEKPQAPGDGAQGQQETKGNAAGAERPPQADLGGAGAGGGPAPATERPAGIVASIEVDAANIAHKALDLGEEGLNAIADTLGRTVEHPPATRIAGS